jgi:hypothetical protein
MFHPSQQLIGQVHVYFEALLTRVNLPGLVKPLSLCDLFYGIRKFF